MMAVTTSLAKKLSLTLTALCGIREERGFLQGGELSNHCFGSGGITPVARSAWIRCGRGTPELRLNAVTGPKLGTPDRSNQMAGSRAFPN